MAFIVHCDRCGSNLGKIDDLRNYEMLPGESSVEINIKNDPSTGSMYSCTTKRYIFCSRCTGDFYKKFMHEGEK